MHVIGIPVADGYEKGLSKQVAKTKIFTKERLSYLQDKMRENMEKGMELNRDVFGDLKLKEKEKDEIRIFQNIAWINFMSYRES